MIHGLVLAAATGLLLAGCGDSSRVEFPPPQPSTVPIEKLAGTWTQVSSDDRQGTITMIINDNQIIWTSEPRSGSFCRFTGRAATVAGGDAMGHLSVTLDIDTCREKLVYRSYKIVAVSNDSVTLSEDPEVGGDGKPQVFKRAPGK